MAHRLEKLTTIITAGLLTLWTTLLSSFVHAEQETLDFWAPGKPLTIIVPWSPGGATDQITRITAIEIEKAIGQKVVVVNQPGATGSIGTRSVLESKRDGYTWSAGTAKYLGIYPLLGMLDTKLKDWYVYQTITNYPLISVHPDSPYYTAEELLEDLASRPGQIAVATAGFGSTGHVVIEAITQKLGTRYKHIPYDGGNPAIIATVAGETDVTTQLASEQVSLIRGKRLRPLAVVGNQSLAISGYGSVPPISNWLNELPRLANSFGIFIPADSPPKVLKTFEKIWRQEIVSSSTLHDFANDMGMVFSPSWGKSGLDLVRREVQADAWTLYQAGYIDVSPQTVGIQPLSPIAENLK